MEKGNPWAPLVAITIGAATMENSMAVPQKIKNRTTIWSSNPTSGYIYKGNETIISKRYLYFHVYGSNIHNNQGTETT